VYFVTAFDSALWRNHGSSSGLERLLSHTHHYKGYVVVDDTAMDEEGAYRARAIVVRIVDGRVRSQRFIDLESFAEESAARQRAIAAAEAWIDGDEDKDKLALPTSYSTL
jgi:hypothetical protein